MPRWIWPISEYNLKTWIRSTTMESIVWTPRYCGHFLCGPKVSTLVRFYCISFRVLQGRREPDQLRYANGKIQPSPPLYRAEGVLLPNRHYFLLCLVHNSWGKRHFLEGQRYAIAYLRTCSRRACSVRLCAFLLQARHYALYRLFGRNWFWPLENVCFFPPQF